MRYNKKIKYKIAEKNKSYKIKKSPMDRRRRLKNFIDFLSPMTKKYVWVLPINYLLTNALGVGVGVGVGVGGWDFGLGLGWG